MYSLSEQRIGYVFVAPSAFLSHCSSAFLDIYVILYIVFMFSLLEVTYSILLCASRNKKKNQQIYFVAFAGWPMYFNAFNPNKGNCITWISLNNRCTWISSNIRREETRDLMRSAEIYYVCLYSDMAYV